MAESEIEVNIFAKDSGYDLSGVPSLTVPHNDVSRAVQAPPAPGYGDIKRAGPVKVIAISTSPMKENGNTSMLLDPFLAGMKEAGADIELYYSRDLVIFPCCGNLNCTIRTPGKCMAYDDMIWLRQKIGQADILVLASPLYFNGQLGPEGASQSMRSLLRRLVPGQSPCADEPYEHAVHTTKEPVNLRKVIFVSGCGFWEIDDFYPVLTHIKSLCHNTFPEFAGNIGDGHGVILNGAIRSGASIEAIAATARSAGRRLINDECSAVDLAGLELVTRQIYDQILGD
jgi:hypothetical protein